MEFKETKFTQEEIEVVSVQLLNYNYLDYGMNIEKSQKVIIYLNNSLDELIISNFLDKCLKIPVIAEWGGYAKGTEHNYYRLNHVFEDKINFNENLLKNCSLLNNLFRSSHSFVIVKFDKKSGIIYYEELGKKQACLLLENKVKEKRNKIKEEEKNRNLNEAINIFSKLTEEEQKELLVKLLINKNESPK